MTRQQQPKRVPGFLVAAVALLLIAGTVFGIGTYYKHKRIREMRDLIATVPAPYTLTVDAVSGSLFGRTLTLTGVKGTAPFRGATLSYSIDNVATEPLNPAAFTDGGVRTLAGRIAFTGLRGNGPAWTFSAASGVLEDVQGDFTLLAREKENIRSALAEILREQAENTEDENRPDAPRKRHTALLRENNVPLEGFFTALDTLVLGAIALDDAKLTVATDKKECVLTTAAFRASRYSLMRPGPMKITALALGVDGKTLVSLDEWSMEGFVIGGGAGMMDLLTRHAAPEEVNDALRENGFSLDGFRLQGLLVNIPSSGTGEIPVRMRDLDFSLRINAESASLRYGYNGLEAETRQVLAAFDAKDRAFLEQFLPGRLIVSSTLNADLLWREDSLTDLNLAPFAVSIEGMGAVSLSANMLGLSKQYEQNQALINAFSLNLTDAGASDILFRIAGKEEGQKPEDLRAMAVMMVRMLGASLPGPAWEVAEHFAAFLKTPGGAFSLAVKPASPFDPNAISSLLQSDPDSLGITSSFTPGK